MNCAPVLIITLNRFQHFSNCVESLSQNKHAQNTHLFIALDAPLKESHIDGYHKISEYLENISGFKEVTIFRRSSNLGAARNARVASEEIFKRYDRLIFSEDDNFFSKNFLEFINIGLEQYAHDKKVFSICGYNYPIDIPKTYQANIYMWKGFSAWGYGTWRDKFDTNIFSLENIKSFVKNPINVYKLGKNASHYLPALLHTINKNYVTGDTAICMHLIKNNMYCVFPTITKVRNLGHDGSGIHCGVTNLYLKQLIDENYSFENFVSSIEYENKEIYRILRAHFDNDWKSKTKNFIKYLLFLLGIKY